MRAAPPPRPRPRATEPPAEDAYERADWRLLADELPRLLEVLGERERTVIRSHHAIRRPERTLREIGEVLGVSAERVRQIEQAAIAKLNILAT